MDPDVTLDEILALADALEAVDFDDERIHQLARRVSDLDGWMEAGGFLPVRWRGNR